ncbi:hypothetical protein [Agathobaculum desmolans]|uniref:hypothetical protein n=1 Tax=Agathobaculum desmolans TaxID=39484 RepID=UPI00248DC66B|nr:hypothetical protein [Agathobaculum desmolans]
MRVFRNSAAWILLQTSVIFGQLPYHALKLVISNYELMQDAFQKLCRAGYLEVVKAPGHKSFFATDAGFKTYCRMLHKEGRTPIRKKPAGTRNIQKAIRLSRINEARMFFAFLGHASYQTSLEIKREMEKKDARSSDSLKYSRFVGKIKRGKQVSLIYHFGNGNQRLNPNGESNASVWLREEDTIPCEKFILTETEKGLVDILEYSLWVRSKRSDALRHMQLNYYISYDDNAVLLPLTIGAGYFAQAFGRKDWPQMVRYLEDGARPADGIFLSTLDGRWMDVLVYLSKEHDPDVSVQLTIWDFQLPILTELHRRGLLPEGIPCDGYHISDYCNGIQPDLV